MVFEIYLKDEIGNQIAQHLDELPKVVTVASLTINDGLLKKGNYYIPVEHILFIEEIV